MHTNLYIQSFVIKTFPLSTFAKQEETQNKIISFCQPYIRSINEIILHNHKIALIQFGGFANKSSEYFSETFSITVEHHNPIFPIIAQEKSSITYQTTNHPNYACIYTLKNINTASHMIIP